MTYGQTLRVIFMKTLMYELLKVLLSLFNNTPINKLVLTTTYKLHIYRTTCKCIRCRC